MRIFAIGLCLLACGCATMPEEERYVASGDDPQWLLSIAGNLIRFTVGHAQRHQVSPLQVFRFPRVAPVRSGDRAVWTASASGKTIVIESEFAPRSPCSHRGPEAVRVIVDGREYRGCGGRQILVRAD